MIGYVTVEVHGTNMDGASRHAHRLANNFLDDVESMQRESRARDRRAMSHFDSGIRSTSLSSGPCMDWTQRRRSMSRSYISTPHTPATTSAFVGTHPRYQPHHRVVVQQSPVVMMVGSKSHNYPSLLSHEPASRLVYSRQPAEREKFWYDQILVNPEEQLPTSRLRAHSPPKKHYLTPGARDLLSYRYYNPLRRALSMADLYDSIEEPVSQLVHSTVSRRTPYRSRLSSVPPAPVRSYRPVYYNSDVGLSPTPVPRTYLTSSQHHESPYYLSPYSRRIAEPTRPILTSHYSTSPAPVTRRYTYYYPPVMTGRQYYPTTTATMHRSTSYSNMLPEVQHERRRVERRLDDVMDYKLPSPDYYRAMRGSLRGINDKLDEHRRMLDRYTGIDMNVAPSSVEDRIESKFRQLASSIPETDRPRSHGPTVDTSELVTNLYYNSPLTTKGYGQGIAQSDGGHVSELRGRIKRLLCRSRRDPHYYRYWPTGN